MLKNSLLHFKWWVLLYIALGFTIQLLSGLGIVTFQRLLDAATAGGDMAAITGMVLVYGALLAGTVLLNYADELPASRLSHGLSERLKVLALSKLSRIDYQAYQSYGTGQMVKMIENGAAAGTGILFSFLLKTAHELLPTLLFSLLFISFYDMRIMLVIGLGYIVVFAVANLLLGRLYKLKTTILKEQESMSRYSVRGFMELVVFRTNKRYAREIEKLSETARGIVYKSTQLRMVHESFFAIFELFITAIKIAVILYGIRSVVAGEASIGVVVALLLFIDRIYQPIAVFNVLFVDYRLNRAAYTRFKSFMEAPEDAGIERGRPLTHLQGRIAFRDVSFHYGEQRVLNSLSFTIEPGMSVAIVGSSGGGKSTVIKLLAGLLKKDSGEIRLDGIDIDDIRLDSYYDHISFISQETPVFDTTIRGNIAFDRAISDDELFAILEKVRLKEKVASLPQGLNTLVGEKGLKLSGGEKQRLAFARVIAQQRSLLILDEPVSALDNVTEKGVMETVFREFAGKTIVIVAHRLSAIRDVDKIIVLENGSVAGEGTFDELMAGCGAFVELWNKEGRMHCDGL